MMACYIRKDELSNRRAEVWIGMACQWRMWLGDCVEVVM